MCMPNQQHTKPKCSNTFLILDQILTRKKKKNVCNLRQNDTKSKIIYLEKLKDNNKKIPI